MQAKKPQFTAFGAKTARTLERRTPVYLRVGDAWIQVRTFAPEGDDAYVGVVESATGELPANAGFQIGDWVRFEQRHVFSACIRHE